MEVEHVFLLKTDIGSEILANNALPRGEESIIEEFLKLFGQIHILELCWFLCFLLNEFDGFQSHIYMRKVVDGQDD